MPAAHGRQGVSEEHGAWWVGMVMSGSPVPALSEGLSPGLSSGRVNGGSAWLTGDPEALDRRAARSDLLRFDCFDIHICEAGRSRRTHSRLQRHGGKSARSGVQKTLDFWTSSRPQRLRFHRLDVDHPARSIRTRSMSLGEPPTCRVSDARQPQAAALP